MSNHCLTAHTRATHAQVLPQHTHTDTQVTHAQALPHSAHMPLMQLLEHPLCIPCLQVSPSHTCVLLHMRMRMQQDACTLPDTVPLYTTMTITITTTHAQTHTYTHARRGTTWKQAHAPYEDALGSEFLMALTLFATHTCMHTYTHMHARRQHSSRRARTS